MQKLLIFNNEGALTTISNNSHEKYIQANYKSKCLPQDGPSHTTDKCLNIVFWNINDTGNKNCKLYDDDVHKLLFDKHDIIILTETHVKREINFENIPLFTFYNFPRKQVHRNAPWPSGGIGIFIRDNGKSLHQRFLVMYVTQSN